MVIFLRQDRERKTTFIGLNDFFERGLKMKKVFTLVLALMLLLSVTVGFGGCGNTESGQNNNGGQNLSENGGQIANNNGNQSGVKSSEEMENDQKAAQEAFENLVNAIKSVDMEAAGKYVDTGSLTDVSVDGLEGGDAVIEAVFSKLESEIVGTAYNPDGTVTVIANLTTIDLTGVLGQCTVLVMNELSSGKITDEQLDARTEEIFREEMMKEGLPTVTNQVSTTVKKADDGWKVEMNDTFQNAISGGFLGSIMKAKQSMNN